MNTIEESNQGNDHPSAPRANPDSPLKPDERAGSEHPPRSDDQHDGAKVSTTAEKGTGFKLAIAALLVFVGLAIGFAISFFVRSEKEAHARQVATSSTDATPAVDVVHVRPTPSAYPLVLPGQTAGWYESTIDARVDGYVGQWFCDIGDPVKAGEVLATIETPELDQQLGAAKARAKASAAQVQVAAANESIAKITYDRWWNSPKGVVSEQERQEKKATYDSAVAQFAAAEAQHQLDEAGVARLDALEAFKQVVAPYDGVITSRHIDIGDLITAGNSSSHSSLYTLAQANVIRTFVDVPQKLAAEMVVGLEAAATSDQFPGQVFRGKVARSSRSIDPQSRTQRTEVDIPNKDLVLLPGMYVQVTFQLNQQGLLQVPAASIVFRPGGLQVAVVDDDDKVVFRPVNVAKDDGATVELASGVRENERVALNISNYIVAGEKVNPVDVDKQVASESSPPPPPPAPATETGAPAQERGPSRNYTPAPNSGSHPPAPAKAPPAQPQAIAPPSTTGPTSEPATPLLPAKADGPAGSGEGAKAP